MGVHSNLGGKEIPELHKLHLQLLLEIPPGFEIKSKFVSESFILKMMFGLVWLRHLRATLLM